jgi:hypothetical protein
MGDHGRPRRHVSPTRTEMQRQVVDELPMDRSCKPGERLSATAPISVAALLPCGLCKVHRNQSCALFSVHADLYSRGDPDDSCDRVGRNALGSDGVGRSPACYALPMRPSHLFVILRGRLRCRGGADCDWGAVDVGSVVMGRALGEGGLTTRTKAGGRWPLMPSIRLGGRPEASRVALIWRPVGDSNPCYRRERAVS